jgi:acyl-CoA synthetase (NDP forming)
MTHDLSALFDPKGIIITGVSNHPGKFGFVTLHNLLVSGYEGAIFPIGREPGEALGQPVLGSIDDVPEGEADMIFICTPQAINEDLLRAAAAKGVRAAFFAAAGYREAGPDGAEAERRLVALADELGVAVAGPNGQGVISTPSQMCAQIVAPYPPPGRIAVASQSGNFVSSFLNLAQHTGVGISRAVAAGNAAVLGIADYVEWFADDPETSVCLVYMESVDDGRDMFERLRAVAKRKPVVVVKGGASDAGARAAASHTGALASDDTVFDGMCRQAGLIRASDVQEAFDVAATLATQPLPRGNRVVVVTTVGGWGVAAVDAMNDTRLSAAPLPPDLFAAIDELLPPRWSKNNPIDMAGGETRDTVPAILELAASHPDVDSVLFLGIGIQSNTAAMMREGRFYPDHGLERIVDFHERQDARYAEAAAEISARTGTPILVATELADARPDNPGPAATRAAGLMCHSSAGRAIRSLDLMTRHSEWRRARGL